VPALPTETITDILSSVDNTPTLAACALASRTFHDVAIPLLYHTVVLSSSWEWDDYLSFFHGVLETTTADQDTRNRKAAYLGHLKELVLYSSPKQPLVFSPSSSSEDRFPSLHYIEFIHNQGPSYVSLFSHLFNIRHVCIRTFESGRLYHPEMAPVFDKWKNVEMLTFYNWYAQDNGAREVQKAGIPLAWTNLRQITIYPELASHGVILCIPPRHAIPIPFTYMPNPSQFPLLKKFTIMTPARSSWEYDWKRYQKYAEALQEEQKALVEMVLVGTRDNRWP
jgi:hypothetical protein